MMRHTLTFLLPLALLACAHHDRPASTVTVQPQHDYRQRLPGEGPGGGVVAPQNSPPADYAFVDERRCSSDAHCGAHSQCLRWRCVDIDSGKPECQMASVRFPAGSAQVPADQRAELERVSRCLRDERHITVTVAGPDVRERGQGLIELGDRRAQAVADELRRLGVDARQLQVVSYGMRTPLCTSSDNKECSARQAAARGGSDKSM